jgi:hypothetical protein
MVNDLSVNMPFHIQTNKSTASTRTTSFIQLSDQANISPALKHPWYWNLEAISVSLSPLKLFKVSNPELDSLLTMPHPFILMDPQKSSRPHASLTPLPLNQPWHFQCGHVWHGMPFSWETWGTEFLSMVLSSPLAHSVTSKSKSSINSQQCLRANT